MGKNRGIHPKRPYLYKTLERDFPGGPVVKSPPANAGDTESVPGLGRFHMQKGS